MESSISILLGSNSIQVSGPESFVKEMYIKILEDFSIQQFLQRTEKSEIQPAKTRENASDKEGKLNFDKMFTVSGENLSLNFNPPGKKKSDKSRNIALLYLYGKRINHISEESSSDEILKVCQRFGAKDSKNFSNILNKSKKGSFLLFNSTGTPKRWTLTEEGVLEAEKLLESIANGPKEAT